MAGAAGRVEVAGVVVGAGAVAMPAEVVAGAVVLAGNEATPWPDVVVLEQPASTITEVVVAVASSVKRLIDVYPVGMYAAGFGGADAIGDRISIRLRAIVRYYRFRAYTRPHPQPNGKVGRGVDRLGPRIVRVRGAGSGQPDHPADSEWLCSWLSRLGPSAVAAVWWVQVRQRPLLPPEGRRWSHCWSRTTWWDHAPTVTRRGCDIDVPRGK